QIGRRLERRDADPPHLLGKARLRDRDPVLDQHLRLVEIGAELERDRQLHLTVGRALRGHVEHVLDTVHLLLDRGRDRLRDDLRRRAGIRRAHDHRRRHDVGILRDRERPVRDRADDDREDREDGREDRTVDEEPRDVHRRPPARAGAAGDASARGSSAGDANGDASARACWTSGFSSASTATPGRTRWSPLTMTRSSTPTPSRTTRRPWISGPVEIARYCATPRSSTTSTYFFAWSLWIASSGRSTVRWSPRPGRRRRANRPGVKLR